MQKSYRLRTWKGWDRAIDRCARAFAAEFGVTPNLLLASPVTLRRMNVAADKSHVGHESGGTRPNPLEYVELKGFAANGYALTFIAEDDIADNTFALVHAADDETELVASL